MRGSLSCISAWVCLRYEVTAIRKGITIDFYYYGIVSQGPLDSVACVVQDPQSQSCKKRKQPKVWSIRAFIGNNATRLTKHLQADRIKAEPLMAWHRSNICIRLQQCLERLLFRFHQILCNLRARRLVLT